MAQRVMIGMMVACGPELLIADEPTTGLDVTIQAQIFDLIAEVQRETGMSVLLITHDLGVVAETCDRVAVMQAGRVVEIAPVEELFARPRHPYTIRLLGSMLRPIGHQTCPPSRVPIPLRPRSKLRGGTTGRCQSICGRRQVFLHPSWSRLERIMSVLCHPVEAQAQVVARVAG